MAFQKVRDNQNNVGPGVSAGGDRESHDRRRFLPFLGVRAVVATVERICSDNCDEGLHDTLTVVCVGGDFFARRFALSRWRPPVRGLR